MITITLVITAVVIFVLSQFGIVKRPFVVLLIAAIIIASSAFIFRNSLNCPFAQNCPFTICPLNRTK